MDRFYVLRDIGNAFDPIAFDNNKYVLEKIDTGTVEEVKSTLRGKVGSLYLSSTYSPREIDITFWVLAPLVVSGGVTTYVRNPDITSIAQAKKDIQTVCALGTEFRLEIYEGDGPTWDSYLNHLQYYIDVRLTESIEWGNTAQNNNTAVCKGILHLDALDPFFHCPVDSYNEIYLPYSNDKLQIWDSWDLDNYFYYTYPGHNPCQNWAAKFKTWNRYGSITGVKHIEVGYPDIGETALFTWVGSSSTTTIAANEELIYDSKTMTIQFNGYRPEGEEFVFNFASSVARPYFKPCGPGSSIGMEIRCMNSANEYIGHICEIEAYNMSIDFLEI